VQYAQSFNVPLQTDVRVTSLKPNSDSAGYLVETDEAIYEAVNVVIATDQYRLPKIPSCISRRALQVGRQTIACEFMKRVADSHPWIVPPLMRMRPVGSSR